MNTDEIKNILLKHLSLQEIHVAVYDNHYQIFAIDPMFIGKSKLEQHKIIYSPLMKYILDNQIHAISIHVFIPEEWYVQRQLYNF